MSCLFCFLLSRFFKGKLKSVFGGFYFLSGLFKTKREFFLGRFFYNNPDLHAPHVVCMLWELSLCKPSKRGIDKFGYADRFTFVNTWRLSIFFELTYTFFAQFYQWKETKQLIGAVGRVGTSALNEGLYLRLFLLQSATEDEESDIVPNYEYVKPSSTNIHPCLSAIVNYCQSVKFPGFKKIEGERKTFPPVLLVLVLLRHQVLLPCILFEVLSDAIRRNFDINGLLATFLAHRVESCACFLHRIEYIAISHLLSQMVPRSSAAKCLRSASRSDWITSNQMQLNLSSKISRS